MNKLIKSKKIFIIWAVITFLFIVALVGTTVLPKIYYNKGEELSDAEYQYNEQAKNYVIGCELGLLKRGNWSSGLDMWVGSYSLTDVNKFNENAEALDSLIKANNYDSPLSVLNKNFYTADKSYYDNLSDTFEGRIKDKREMIIDYYQKGNKIKNAFFNPAIVIGILSGVLTIFVIILLILSKRAKPSTVETVENQE